MNTNIKIDFQKFAGKNTESILEEKAFYLADYSYARSFVDTNLLIQKLIDGNLENNTELKKYEKDSNESFLICKEITIFYFYLVNIELSLYLKKELREKFMQHMFSSLIYSFWELQDSKDRQVIIHHSDTFNERYRYYDKFSTMIDKKHEGKIKNQINEYTKYMLQRFWDKQDAYFVGLLLQSLALDFLVSINIKKYINP